MEANQGRVFLVGAGPGDPELISVRGLRLIRAADVVVYDRLIHPDLISEADADAELIFAGKSPDHHTIQQELISEILVDRARQGKLVVRLKGGDPFVFGRGGEECLALRAAGIAFEVVPGITSAISVPAYAGIPLTHRGISPAFTVVTGHSCAASSDVDWTRLARAGTLVILMGLTRLPSIASSLIRAGRAAETPAAVIRDGTTSKQETVVGDLSNIAERARHITSPATIVIGEVVSLRTQLDWFTRSRHHGPDDPHWQHERVLRDRLQIDS